MTPKLLENHDVCRQLWCAGMLEAVRIWKSGYAIHLSLKDFEKWYRMILKDIWESNIKEIIVHLLNRLSKSVNDW